MTKILRTVADMRGQVAPWKDRSLQVGLVPTMGALHEGHLSLVRVAKAHCDRVIVSIFVNPIQFNDPTDLEKYPRTEKADIALLAELGVEAVFAPSVSEMYPPGFAAKIQVGGVAETLEGADRPGHFDGVATVVTKLFAITRADMAFFGEKDWQQLQVVRQVVSDLNLPIEIVGAATCRLPTGLALSSRNSRLTERGLSIAPALYKEMQAAAAALCAGSDKDATIRTAVEKIRAAGFEKVDYLELRSAQNLNSIESVEEPARLLAAVWLEGVRLIDNIAV